MNEEIENYTKIAWYEKYCVIIFIVLFGILLFCLFGILFALALI